MQCTAPDQRARGEKSSPRRSRCHSARRRLTCRSHPSLFPMRSHPPCECSKQLSSRPFSVSVLAPPVQTSNPTRSSPTTWCSSRAGDIVVWGKADPGEIGRASDRTQDGELAVRCQGESGGCHRRQGRQLVGDTAQAESGHRLHPHDKGKNTIESFKNVAVGEVWVCSGQSNMEMSVNGSETPEASQGRRQESRPPPVHRQEAHCRDSPIDDQDDLKHFTKWDVSGPETVGGFSAVAYHFGQKLQKELGVPVGLIHTSWGGTPAEAWTSLEALDAEPSLKHYAEPAAKRALVGKKPLARSRRPRSTTR